MANNGNCLEILCSRTGHVCNQTTIIIETIIIESYYKCILSPIQKSSLYGVTPQQIVISRRDPLLDLFFSALWPSSTIFVWLVCNYPQSHDRLLV